MNDESRRLIHDKKVLVFQSDHQFDFRRQKLLGFLWFPEDDGYFILFTEPIAARASLAVDVDHAALDIELNLMTREGLDALDQPEVQARSYPCLLDMENLGRSI